MPHSQETGELRDLFFLHTENIILSILLTFVDLSFEPTIKKEIFGLRVKKPVKFIPISSKPVFLESGRLPQSRGWKGTTFTPYCWDMKWPPPIAWCSLFPGFVFPFEGLSAGRKPKLGVDSPTGDGNLLVEVLPFIPAPVSLGSIENVPAMTCVN